MEYRQAGRGRHSMTISDSFPTAVFRIPSASPTPDLPECIYALAFYTRPPWKQAKPTSDRMSVALTSQHGGEPRGAPVGRAHQRRRQPGKASPPTTTISLYPEIDPSAPAVMGAVSSRRDYDFIPPYLDGLPGASASNYRPTRAGRPPRFLISWLPHTGQLGSWPRATNTLFLMPMSSADRWS